MPTSPRYGFRVSDPDLAAWLEGHESVTATVVDALRTYRLLERHGQTTPRPELIEIRRNLVGIATNINQLAHIANSSGERADFPSTETLEAIASEIRTKHAPALRQAIDYWKP